MGDRFADCLANQIIYGRSRVISRRLYNPNRYLFVPLSCAVFCLSPGLSKQAFSPKTKSPPDAQEGLKSGSFSIHGPFLPTFVSRGVHTGAGGGGGTRDFSRLLLKVGPMAGFANPGAPAARPRFQRGMVLNWRAQ